MGVQTTEGGAHEDGWLFAQRGIDFTELEYTSAAELLTAVRLSVQAANVGINKARTFNIQCAMHRPMLGIRLSSSLKGRKKSVGIRRDQDADFG